MGQKNLIQIVVPPGQSEQVDPRVLDTQRLKYAQNVRFRKDGRAAKRYGNAAVAYGSLGAKPCALFMHEDRQYVVTNAQIRAKHATASGSEQAVGECSRFLPERFDTVRITEASNQPKFPTVAGLNSKVGYWWEENGTIYRRVYRTDGRLIAFASFANGEIPRSVTDQDDLIWTISRSGTILQANSSDFATDVPTASGATSIGTLASSSALFDAAEYSSQYLVAFYSAANTITVQLMTGTTTSDSITATTVGAPNAISVYGTPGENVYLAWVESTGALKVQVFDSNLTSVAGPTTVETAATNANHQPTMIRLSASTVMLIWSKDAPPFKRQMQWCTFGNNGAAGSISTAYNIRAASRPFNGDANAARLDIWVHTDDAALTDGLGWEDQRNYILATISTTTGTLSYQLSAQPLRAYSLDSTFIPRHLPQVVSVDSAWYTCLYNAVRTRDSNSSDTVALVGVSCTAYNASLRDAYRQWARLGRSTYLAGNVTDVHGAHAFETGFAHYPTIENSPIAGTNGALSLGTYKYVAVFEYIDDIGRRHRSAPSVAYSATLTGSNDEINWDLETLAMGHANPSTSPLIASARIHLYRTKVNESSPFYRTTPAVGAPDATGSVAEVAYSDRVGDSGLNEILYTDGGVLPNIHPPACRYVWTVSNRLVLGGLFIPNKVVVSKLAVEGEPAQFTDDDSFAIFSPENVTAVAGLDDVIVIFSEDSIFVVYGDGPNDQGQGAYAQPRRLPTHVGCIDHRSLVEIPDGLIFQSKHGLYLLPRGFGAPIYISGDVQETLATYSIIQSATVCVESSGSSSKLGESTVRFVCSDAESPTASRVLVWDLRTRGWSVDTYDVTLGIGGMWDDLYTVTRADCTLTSPIRQETRSAWGNVGSHAETKLSTGDIRPFGMMGYGDFKQVVLAVEYRDECSLLVDCWVDDEQQPTWTVPLPVSSEIAGDLVYLEYNPKQRTGSSIRLDIYDADDGSPAGGTESVVLHAIQITAEPGTGHRRMPATTHRGP